MTKPRKVYTARQRDKPIIIKPASSYAQAAAKPAKVASVAGPALSSVSVPASKIAGSMASTPARPEVSACLTKEYLETGAVMFKDTCTKEWAINATHVTKTVVPGTSRTCLSKDVHGDGVVMFKDDCTKEWAMNTAEQHARAE